MTRHHTDSYLYHHSRSSEEGTLSSQFHAALSDQDFLLRAALTHDWDTVTGFCEFLKEEVFSICVPDRVLQRQATRVQAATLQLLAKDHWGNSVLHVTCYNQPPARVVRALLAAATAALPGPLSLHALQSRDGSTPLLVASATGASPKVLQALLEVEGGGAMVFRADQTGATPLTELAVHYELQRQSPMHIQTSRPLDQVYLIRQHQHQQNPNHPRSDALLLDAFQTKLELLFQAAWAHQFPASTMISMVHGLAQVAAYCPPVITRLVLRGYPHMISFTDRHGVLPLHLATKPHHRKIPASTCRDTFRQRHAYTVEQLLQAYPAAAREPWQGRSPLMHAIASGYFWNTTTNTRNNNPNLATTQGPLHSLWQAAPEALTDHDPVTGWCPLVLAAMTFASPTTTSTLSKQEQVLQVDTLYNLLRLHPQVLMEEAVFR